MAPAAIRIVSPPELSIASLAIRFRHRFAHAAATRAEAANVLVRLAIGGAVGLGEGCPRRYVTGETVDGARDFLAACAPALLREAVDVASLRHWLAVNAAEVDRHPSAVCAIEMALLDLFARRAGVAVEDLVGASRLDRPLPVTAVYGSASAIAFHVQRWRFGRAGMGEAKLKLTGDPRRDGARARSLARRGRLRVDANNLWRDARAAIAGLAPVAPYAWAVEEPVAPRDWPGMVAVAQETGLAIILDESFTTPADLAAAPEGTRWIANLRVSKLGGVLRTLDAIAVARRRGMAMIVGAQVGETSLLARAGFLAAAAAGPSLRGFEGAYGTHLLAYDIVRPSVTFDARGRIAPAAVSPGWGLDAEPRLAQAFAAARVKR
ncbi:MAG TPA: enolase C-terminal domain-like protein [Stellaceae bacterium]